MTVEPLGGRDDRLTNREFAVWADHAPEEAGQAFLLHALNLAAMEVERGGGPATDADEAVQIAWLRVSHDDWSALRARPDRRVLPTIRLYLRNILSELRRPRKRARFVSNDEADRRRSPGERESREVPPTEAALPDVPMTRKQRSLLTKLLEGRSLDAAATSAGITVAGAKARLQRIAAVAAEPDRWVRGHHPLELPKTTRAELSRLTPRDRELVHWARRPGATRASVARHLGVTTETVKRRLIEIRKTLRQRR